MEDANRAREMRNNPTQVEQRLWEALSARGVAGVRFNRQVRIKPYICDLVARTPRLIIEVDGGQHADSAYDAQRTQYLEAKGYRVRRFWNNDVLGNLEGVVAEIERVLAALPSQHQVKQPPAVSARPGDERPDAPSRSAEGERRRHALDSIAPLPLAGGVGGGHGRGQPKCP